MQKQLYHMVENHLNSIIQMMPHDYKKMTLLKGYNLIKNYSLEKQIATYNLFSKGTTENNLINIINDLAKIPYYDYYSVSKKVDYNYSFIKKMCEELNLNIHILKYKKIMMGVTLYDEKITSKSILSGNLYSLLYIFDDILDSKEINKNDKNDMIIFLNKFLSGQKYDYSNIKNKNLRLITEFICSNFMETFPQKKFPYLYKTMHLFHESQVKEKECSKNINKENENEWYKYIILKSLLSRLSVMSLFKSNISAAEIEQIIKFCPLIQLRDDLEDFSDDLKEKNVTPFNVHILKNYQMRNNPLDILLKNVTLIKNDKNEDLINIKIIETLIKHHKNKIKNECQYDLNLGIYQNNLNLLMSIYDKINFNKSFIF